MRSNCADCFRPAVYGGLLGWLLAAGLLVRAVAAQAEPPSFAAVLNGMQERWAATMDYQCRFETLSSNGETTRDVVLAYFYRRPAQIRMEVLEGPYAGSLLIYNRAVAPRQVRVLAGNALVAFLQRMLYGEFFAVDHEWLVDLRGNGIHESDWAHFIAEHRKYVLDGTARLLGEEILDGRRTYRYRLVSKSPPKAFSITEEQVWVDAETFFPIQYFQYDAAGQLVRKARVSDLKFNTGINAHLFVDFHPDSE
jgi:outer membrane lipoprotein-sorting protein